MNFAGKPLFIYIQRTEFTLCFIYLHYVMYLDFATACLVTHVEQDAYIQLSRPKKHCKASPRQSIVVEFNNINILGIYKNCHRGSKRKGNVQMDIPVIINKRTFTRNHNIVNISNLRPLAANEVYQNEPITVISNSNRRDSKIVRNNRRICPNNLIYITPDYYAPLFSTMAQACLLNCQSLRNKADVIRDYVTEYDFDVVLLTETWLSTDDVENTRVIGDLSPPGYSFLHRPRPSRGGGCGFLYKTQYKAQREQHYQAASFESLEVHLTSAQCRDIRFVVIYRPPNCSFPSFVSEFSDYLGSLLTKPGHFIVAGDFNVHMDISTDTNTRKLNELFSSHGIIQHVGQGTHDSGHIIDLVCSSEREVLVQNTEVRDTLSDHCAIHFTMHLQKPYIQRKRIQYRKYKAIDRLLLQSDIQLALSCNFVSDMSEKPIDERVDFLQ